MKVLIDSDIAIEILRARDQAVLTNWRELKTSKTVLLCSPVTVAEVWAGALPQEHDLISRFFRPLVCAPADYETGQIAGEYLRQFARSHGLEVPDALIAATAVQQQAALWTRNRRHYPMKAVAFFTHGVQ